MIIRTPRRRISPRTRRRYRVIRNFFRKALGNPSQQNIKINSSIAINVTDLKHKIVGIEHQLKEISKHCQELVDIGSNSRQTESTERKSEQTINKKSSKDSIFRKLKDSETKLIYKTSESQYRKTEDSDCKLRQYDIEGRKNILPNVRSQCYNAHDSKTKKNRNKFDFTSHDMTDDCELDTNELKTQSVCEKMNSAYSTSSYHSLAMPRNSHYMDNKYKHDKKQRRDIEAFPFVNQNEYKKQIKRNIMGKLSSDQYQHYRNRRSKRERSQLDHDFIADIIKKQYQSVKLFGQEHSDTSQYSAPVCRDQEYPIHENIQEDTCSCCYRGFGCRIHGDHDSLSDLRSICDTRLYSSKRYAYPKHFRKHINTYNDSRLYDMIPVKEKSSPKTRRKFVEDNMIPYGYYYKEVPPSPKTHRPRLNLKAQYHTDFENYMSQVKQQNRIYSPSRIKKQKYLKKLPESDITSEMFDDNIKYTKIQKSRKKHKSQENVQIQENMGTMSSLQYSAFANEQTNTAVNDTPLNKTLESELSAAKTDKALSEIKDILQNFLQEIKKETTASQCDKSDVTNKETKRLSEIHPVNIKTDNMQNSSHNSNNCGLGQCSTIPSFMPTFANACYYPIIPVCPMNSVQNGYIVPSPSYTCSNCANNIKDTDQKHCSKHKEDCGVDTSDNNETHELLKEIYRYVAQNPKHENRHRKSPRQNPHSARTKILTSRSAGGSSVVSKHDAKVGTPKMKYYSKSCEAIRSKMTSDTCYSRTNATYSDTILEKLSLEVTQSTSESELSSKSMADKAKESKLSKVLRSFGLLKKKKNKDVIEELSESESTIEVEIKTKPPFRQKVTNYSMHGQEYFQRPPVPQNVPHYPFSPQNPYEYQQIYNPTSKNYPEAGHSQDPDISSPYNHRAYYSSPHDQFPPHPNPFDPRYSPVQPQVPLCLKEIEVKSIATQSEKKMSFFRKLKQRIQPPTQSTMRSDECPQRNCSTQTAQGKAALFNWKNLQNKSAVQNTDPMKFSFKTEQKRLAQGDTNIRNAMLKKLFYKRNPFSPRNLIVKTLLGKDKTSFGEAPKMYRPRMFL